jgi:hypothetical protein
MAALTALNLTAAQLLNSTKLLSEVLLYHVSATPYPTIASLVAAKTIATAGNGSLSVSNGTAGTIIGSFGSNATIVPSGFAGVIQPNGSAVSAACWPFMRVLRTCTMGHPHVHWSICLAGLASADT